MPSDHYGGRGRNIIYNWRVKNGKNEVFSNPNRGNCVQWIRDHQKEYTKKLRLIPPNT